MKINDRVRSEFNTGTVTEINPKKGTVTVHWDRFMIPIEIQNENLEVVSE